MLRLRNTGIQILIVVCAWLLIGQVQAARHKEVGTQNNIYISEWARLKHQAELGDPDALFILGNYYYQPPKGSGFKKDLRTSALYYFKAGIRGNAAAQYNLAFMLHKGQGVAENIIESYVWFKLASLNQSPVAKHINQLSAKVVVSFEQQLSPNQLSEASGKIDFYQQVIQNKTYRKAKFPG